MTCARGGEKRHCPNDTFPKPFIASTRYREVGAGLLFRKISEQDSTGGEPALSFLFQPVPTGCRLTSLLRRVRQLAASREDGLGFESEVAQVRQGERWARVVASWGRAGSSCPAHAARSVVPASSLRSLLNEAHQLVELPVDLAQVEPELRAQSVFCKKKSS